MCLKKMQRKSGRNIKKSAQDTDIQDFIPIDNECDSSKEIYLGNVALIDEADVVIANGNEFRGEMDVGTAFEVGFAAAKGKKIYIYMDDIRTLVEKYGTEDEQGRFVEDFGHPLNLMLSESSEIVKGTFEDCIKKLSQ